MTSSALRIDNLPDTMQAHQKYRYRYTVSYFAQSDDGMGLWGNRLTTYAAIGTGMEEQVARQFAIDYPPSQTTLLGISEV
jgi:hypothetical protein